MQHVIDLVWKQNMAFECEMDGHRVVIDASKESGGDDLGPRPKKLMLTALAGCTGIDVIAILKKMKVEPEAFHVIVEGDLTDENPVRYQRMNVIYQFKGKDLPMDKLEKAVKLSKEKYCGVSAAYRLAIGRGKLRPRKKCINLCRNASYESFVSE
jgi:putative redox protein